MAAKLTWWSRLKNYPARINNILKRKRFQFFCLVELVELNIGLVLDYLLCVQRITTEGGGGGGGEVYVVEFSHFLTGLSVRKEGRRGRGAV